MRVALFGGSFDPPHRGHLAVARAAAERFGLDRVLFAPAAHQPLKPVGALASFADRMAMVELLCREDVARFGASDADAPRSGGEPNYTIDTLAAMRGELPGNAELFAIVGADSFLDFRRWRDSDALLAAAKWIVVSRPGFVLSDLAGLHLTAEQMSRVALLQGIAEPASATAIRDCLRAGESSDRCNEFLTGPVFAYICERGLYACSSPGVRSLTTGK